MIKTCKYFYHTMLLKLSCLWFSGRALAQHIVRSWVRSTAPPENGSTILLFVLVIYPVSRLIYKLNSTTGISVSEEACCTCSVITCGLLLLHWRFDHCTKFSWIELLWREYLVLYSWGGLYHLDSLGLWDLISCLWEKFICIWLALTPKILLPGYISEMWNRATLQVLWNYSQASRD